MFLYFRGPDLEPDHLEGSLSRRIYVQGEGTLRSVEQESSTAVGELRERGTEDWPGLETKRLCSFAFLAVSSRNGRHRGRTAVQPSTRGHDVVRVTKHSRWFATASGHRRVATGVRTRFHTVLMPGAGTPG